MACGGRLKLSDFWLNHEDASLFAKSQWPIHRFFYLAWRVLLAAYLIGWLVVNFISNGNIGASFVFLTDWTYAVMTLYAVSSCIGTFYFTFADGGNRLHALSSGQQATVSGHKSTISSSSDVADQPLFQSPPGRPVDEADRPRLPHYFKLVWLLFSICLAVNPIVTVVFWSFLVSPRQSAVSWAININSHALNTAFIYADLLLSAIPVRLVHFIYGSLYGLVYITFTLIYFWAGGLNPDTKDTAIYPNILDWSNPDRSVLSVGVIAAVEPVVFLAGYGIYRLRHFAHKRCFGTRLEESPGLTTADV